MFMKKSILLTLLFTQFAVSAAPWDPVKIFDRVDHQEVGVYISCAYGPLSPIATPNIMLIAHDSHNFEVQFSLAAPTGIVCSPIPPEFIDDVRHYFSLGDLSPGEYNIVVNYVTHDNTIPFDGSSQLYTFDQLTFQIAHPIPALGLFAQLFLVLLVVVFVKRNRTNKFLKKCL